MKQREDAMDKATQTWLNFFDGDRTVALRHESWSLGYLMALSHRAALDDEALAAHKRDAKARLQAARAVLYRNTAKTQ